MQILTADSAALAGKTSAVKSKIERALDKILLKNDDFIFTPLSNFSPLGVMAPKWNNGLIGSGLKRSQLVAGAFYFALSYAPKTGLLGPFECRKIDRKTVIFPYCEDRTVVL